MADQTARLRAVTPGSLRERVTEEEWQVRCDLAAASTNITYTATIASPGAGTPSYSIEARLEAIG